MTQFETIEKTEHSFGTNNFVEVALKRAIGEHGTTDFVSVSRGYIAHDGSRRYKTALTLPYTGEVLAWVGDNLGRISSLNGGE